jgi:hypothetical protein
MSRFLKIPRILRRPSHKRQVTVALIGLGILLGWTAAGTHILSAINPALRHELSLATRPALDVWITPPDYAGTAPIIISTPAGIMYEQDTLTIPLVIDHDTKDFTADEHGDFAATEKLMAGSTLSIVRGSQTLASWKINVQPDHAPRVSLTEPLAITSGKTLRVAYHAADDFGVAEVAVRVTPSDPLPGAHNTPVEIALPITRAKEIAHVDFSDLTAHPWAGQPVLIQIVATNVAGLKSMTDPVEFTLPERGFFHPVARVLIDERKKLMQHPDDENLREEAANVMAGIAHETADYHGDPVVLMALRTGAVRLILDRDHDTALSVNDLLWQAATRIEDGYAGQAQQMLHDARQDLASAISRNAGPQEIQTLTKRLQAAIQIYVSGLSTHRSGNQAQAGSAKIQ